MHDSFDTAGTHLGMRTPMEWNTVICLYAEGFRRAVRALSQRAPIEKTKYHNVLVAAPQDSLAFLEQVERLTHDVPALYDAISRVAPAMRCFDFHSAEEFERKAIAVLEEWVPLLAGRSFHVRLHRRGFKYDDNATETERRLGAALLKALAAQNLQGRISFSDPDAVIAIDTVDDRAGAGLWTREDRSRYKMLRPD